MRNLFLCLGLCMCQIISTTAQSLIDEIVKQPNISWAMEFNFRTSQYQDRDVNENLKFDNTSSFLLKYQASPTQGENVYEIPYDVSLFSVIMDAIDDPSFVAYRSSNLKEIMSAKELKKMLTVADTIMTFNPYTYEEEIQVLVNSLNPKYIKDFEQRAILYYDKKEQVFKVKVLAIAPLLDTYDKQGNINRTPLFWMKVNNVQNIDIDSKHINWVSRVLANTTFEEKAVKKGSWSKDRCLEEHFVYNKKNSKKIAIYHPLKPLGSDKISLEEISELKPKNITELRIAQDWAWNRKKKVLMVHYLGFGPIVKRYDDAGKFLNSSAAYYILMKGVK